MARRSDTLYTIVGEDAQETRTWASLAEALKKEQDFRENLELTSGKEYKGRDRRTPALTTFTAKLGKKAKGGIGRDDGAAIKDERRKWRGPENGYLRL